MDTSIVLGMDLPQLELSNFINAETGELDINNYFRQLGDTLSEIKDEEIRSDVIYRYTTLRRNQNQEFDKAYTGFFIKALETTFNCEVKKAFRVGEFYATKIVKERMDKLYSHEFAPYELYDKVARMTDLEKNGWFSHKYAQRIINGQRVNGIWITDCLI